MALGIIVEEEVLELLYGEGWPIRLSPSWILLFACFQVHWKRTHLGVSLGLWVPFQVHFVQYQSIAIAPGICPRKGYQIQTIQHRRLDYQEYRGLITTDVLSQYPVQRWAQVARC
jgi:hypothetical protein